MKVKIHSCNYQLLITTLPIRVGPGTNIQEGCILHADPGFPAIIGAGVTVGHGAGVQGQRLEPIYCGPCNP